MATLIIDGIEMPGVNSMTISANKIWSAKAGRAANGEMKGDIVAIKLKAQVQFVPLSDEQAALVDAAISPAYFSATFKNPRTGKVETRTMYASDGQYPVYSYADDMPRYVGTAVDIIEK